MSVVINLVFLGTAVYAVFHQDRMLFVLLFNFFLRALESANIGYSTLIIELAGITLYTSDIFILSLFSAMLLSVNTESKIHLGRLPVFIYVVIVIGSSVVGLSKFGFSGDWISEFRKLLGFVVPLVYFMNHPFPIDQHSEVLIQRFMRVVLIMCSLLWLYGFIVGTFFSDSLRVIAADYAWVLSLWTLYLFYQDIVVHNSRLSVETILNIGAILVLQHNSVYMALGSGIVVIVLLRFNQICKGSVAWIAQVAFIVLAIFVIILFIPNNPIVEAIGTTFSKFSQATSTEEVGTIGTRRYVWNQLLRTIASPMQWLFGQPVGTGYHVMYRGLDWDHSPHSGYIENALRTGIVGTSALLFMILRLVRHSMQQHKTFLVATLISLLFYWYPYSITPEAGVLIGMTIAITTNGTSYAQLNQRLSDDGNTYLSKEKAI